MKAQENSWIRILKNGTPEVIYSKEMVAFQQATIFVAHVSFGHEVAISWMRQLDETEMLATKAKEKKITKVYFDRGIYKYHGRVKIFAETLRKNGLNF